MSYIDFGYDSLLTKSTINTDLFENGINSENVDALVATSSIGFSKTTMGVLETNQNMESSNFVTTSAGWQIKGNGDVEFNSGTFRGSLVAGSIHIPDQNTTANSFHTDGDGNSWWGCTNTDFTADSDNALAYILKTGVAKFQSVTITSGIVSWGTVSGTTDAPDDNATVGGTFNLNISGGGSGNTQTGNDGYTTLFREDKFGDGSDGDVTISSDTTLTSDVYYNNLTVNNGFTLICGGYRVFVKETLTNNETINRVGNVGGAGGAASGSSGGTAGIAGLALAAGFLNGALAGTIGVIGPNGTASGNGTIGNNGNDGTVITNAIGSNGTDGTSGGYGGGRGTGDWAGGTGGTGGVATSALTKPKNLTELLIMRDFSPTTSVKFNTSASSASGGSGGSGWSGSGAGSSGGGGGSAGSAGNGGIVVLCAKTIINTGTISTKGGTGGIGGDGGDATGGIDKSGGGGGAGGNGGSGGFLILIYQSLTDTGTITSAGGDGGAGGAGGLKTSGQSRDGAAGSAGNAGATGQIVQLEV